MIAILVIIRMFLILFFQSIFTNLTLRFVFLLLILRRSERGPRNFPEEKQCCFTTSKDQPYASALFFTLNHHLKTGISSLKEKI
jgi:hypothetical protein